MTMKRSRRCTMKISLGVVCILSSAGPSQSFLLNNHHNIHQFIPQRTHCGINNAIRQSNGPIITHRASPSSFHQFNRLPLYKSKSNSRSSSRSIITQLFSTRNGRIKNSKNKKPNQTPSTRKKTALDAAPTYTTKVPKRSSSSTTLITSKKNGSMEENDPMNNNYMNQNSRLISRSKNNENSQKPNYITNSQRAKRLLGKSSSAGAWYQRDEMMQHEILSREDEVILGSRVVKAKNLRDGMIDLIEKRKLELMELEEMDRDLNMGLNWETNNDGLLNDDLNGVDLDGVDMGSMGIVDVQSDFENQQIGDQQENDEEQDDEEDYEFDNDFIAFEANSMDENEEFVPNRYDGQAHFDFRGDRRISSTLVQDGSKLITASIDADLNQLSDEDVQNVLNVHGGKIELRRILYNGARARNKLMRSNIRLVVSIGKKWMGRNKDNGGMSDRYNGSWDRPSLDEVIQEGMLGLARAVDKYDPDRGLRFSTYSTHWITSYVRQCFQASATGCLKVPSQLHDIKTSYKSIVKRYIESSEGIPSEEQIASEIGVSLSRLRTAIRVTESLLSIDEPVYMGGNAAFKGSGAGGDLSGENSLLISDRLECSEIAPEDYVENGFLRQTLENAMASELSPYERDILRLRLGLDDGQTRTVKQVVEECGGDVSIAEVRSAERRAFKKLRSPNAVHAHNLVAYLDMVDIDLDSFDNRRW